MDRSLSLAIVSLALAIVALVFSLVGNAPDHPPTETPGLNPCGTAANVECAP